MRIKAEDTMGIIIDFQERLMPQIAENQELVKRSDILIKGLRALEVPLIVTRQYPKGLGGTVKELHEAITDLPVYDKIHFGAYSDEAIKGAVDAEKKRNIILCGAEAHICVLQTLIDLQEAGYQTILVVDCISSRSLNDKKTAISRAKKEGAIVTTSEAILFEITEKAGTDTFKIISNLIK